MRFGLGFVAAVVVLVTAAIVVILTGAYNVAASDKHFAVVRWALDTTMRNSVERRARTIQVPAAFSEKQVQNGFANFDAMCVQCHGAPGSKPADWASGMRPRPPNLAEKARHWNSAQLFWILQNGIKMTGMPALGATHSDEELWSLVAFLDRLPTVTPDEYARLRKEVGQGGPSEHGRHGK